VRFRKCTKEKSSSFTLLGMTLGMLLKTRIEEKFSCITCLKHTQVFPTNDNNNGGPMKGQGEPWPP